MQIHRKGGKRLKRRVFAAFLCCMLIFGCAITARADSAATHVENMTTITSDGECSVNLRINIHLESADSDITFPLPLGATDIEVNGGRCSTSKTDNAILVDLNKIVDGVIGDYTIRIDYKLKKTVAMNQGKMILTLPLISGFSYPVESMDFTINLPGEVVNPKMEFTASYQMSNTGSNINVAVNGHMISGQILAPLKDHETLVMTMEVDPEMFPGVSTYERNGNPEIVPMIVCAVLALLYWLIWLRAMPLVHVRRATPPEGVSAGELGCRLTFAGADLTMMVFTWAQLGYILIHLDDNGRVWLHKRMDMGNERSLFEVKCFKSLFGKRRSIDGTGYQYARLCRKFAKQVPGEKTMCRPKSGNIRIFRALSCGIGLFCGICIAMNLTGILVLQILYAIILAVFGVVSAWKIQEGMYRIHIRGKLPLYICGGLCLVWLILGLLAGQILIALLGMVLPQLLAGLAAAYGGRRNEMGRQNAAQILGLRHYLKKISKEELKRVLNNDPEFFYNMAPYAIAMGVSGEFAKRFGKRKMRPCPYFVSGMNGKRTAQEWAAVMQEAADILDKRQRQMEWEKFAIIRVR